MKNEPIYVKECVPYDIACIIGESVIPDFGGFFDCGMRWKDYLEDIEESEKKYAEAFRKYVVDNGIRHGGDWSQNKGGCPIFSDGKSAYFSFRAWGDIMAAIWSEEEGEDYDYMNFYMECLVPPKSKKETK